MSINNALKDELMRQTGEGLNSRAICKVLLEDATLSTDYGADLQALHNDFIKMILGTKAASNNFYDALASKYSNVGDAAYWKTL